MSRIGRIFRSFSLQVETASPLHIGSGELNAFTDAPCARDVSGELFIPGSSVAGSLRALVARLYGDTATEALFGCLPTRPETDEAGDDGTPSALWVFDARAAKQHVEIRDGVGVDRATMGPAAGIKFDLEVVPIGTPFTLRLLLEAGTVEEADDHSAVVRGALAELAAGAWALGARASRGLGWFRAAEGAGVVERTFDLGRASDALTLASEGIWGEESRALDKPETVNVAPARISGTAAPMTVRVTLRADIIEPLAVGGRKKSATTDLAPVQTAVDPGGTVKYVIPGSTLKGAMRSRAEEILRRVVGPDAACDPLGRDASHGASCSGRIDSDLKREKDPAAFASWVEREACSACRLFGMAHWRSAVFFKDAIIEGAEEKAKKFDWVAIDRFTGGAAKGKKFDGTLLVGGHFDIEMLLMEDRLGGTEDSGRLALLLHALLDLETDGLQLGFGKLRGWGQCAVRVNGIEVAYGQGSVLSEVATIVGALESANWERALRTYEVDWARISASDEAGVALRAFFDQSFAAYVETARKGVHA